MYSYQISTSLGHIVLEYLIFKITVWIDDLSFIKNKIPTQWLWLEIVSKKI